MKNSSVSETSQALINNLILNSSFIKDIGLMNGKMGICIFFYLLSRKTSNEIYEEYAGDLLDEVCNQINNNTPADFENGLAGIGWGIEYLAENGFIDADTDGVLSELDNTISHIILNRAPNKLSIRDGFLGYGLFYCSYIRNEHPDTDKLTSLVKKECLIHIIDIIDDKTQDLHGIVQEPATWKPDWDLPCLLGFLGEAYLLNIFNYKVDKIVRKCMQYLEDNPNVYNPLNRFLIVFSLLSLEKKMNRNLSKIINKFDKNISRETLSAAISNLKVPDPEFPMAFLSFLYQRLYVLFDGKKKYLEEANYWCLSIGEIKSPVEANKCLGLFKGIAGLGLALNQLIIDGKHLPLKMQ